MRTTTGTAAIASAIAVTVIDLTLAGAQVTLAPPARLGEPRQTIITTDVALDYQRDTVHVEGEADVTTSTYDFHVGFDRVMSRRITLGTRVGFEGFAQGLDGRKRFDLGARAGGLVPLGSSTIWWPTLGFAYGLTSYVTRDSNVSVRTLTLVAAAPFLWQPARHLLVGIGPTYARDLQSKTGPDADQEGPSMSGFGIHGLLGLWF